MSFLVDTDICSAHLKDARSLTSRFLQHAGRLYVSALTVSELYTWAKRRQAPSSRLVAVREMLAAVECLDVDRDVAEKAGELRAALLDLGKPIPPVDLHIAATAIVHTLTLVTHNSRHFRLVPDLAIQDWLSP